MIPANFALVAWIPVVLLMFSLLPARTAVIYSIIAGMLFLPETGMIKIPGLAYGKLAAVSIATFLGILFFDGTRLFQFRFAWYDSFWLALCLSPFVTSLENGLGLKDGVIECITMMLIWGIPYYIGRIYLTDIHAIREAATAIVVMGLIYAPLCLFEIQFSPQLHRIFYGKHQHSFAQTYRFGGYRPMVFMQHGLAVGLFMAAASLTCFWLWRCGTLKHIWGIPTSWLTLFLMGMTVLCKSSGGVALMLMGLAVLASIWSMRTAVPLVLLVAIAPVYMVTRALGLFDGKALVGAVAMVVNEERAGSLQFRIDAENQLAKKALQKPLFGWGGWDRSKAFNASGEGKAVTDGLWIIALGKRGGIGAAALFGAFLIGPFLLKRRYDPKLWTHPAVGPAVVAAVIVTIHMIDSLPNGMPNAIYYFLGGGLAGLAAYPRTAPTASTAPRRGPIASAPPHATPTPVTVKPVITIHGSAPLGGR